MHAGGYATWTNFCYWPRANEQSLGTLYSRNTCKFCMKFTEVYDVTLACVDKPIFKINFASFPKILNSTNHKSGVNCWKHFENFRDYYNEMLTTWKKKKIATLVNKHFLGVWRLHPNFLWQRRGVITFLKNKIREPYQTYPTSNISFLWRTEALCGSQSKSANSRKA